MPRVTRKPPRRKQPRERTPDRDVEGRLIIDDDLAELAIALDAQRLDKNAVGWFSVPWRFGWNALALAQHVARQHETLEVKSEILSYVAGAYGIHRADAEIYFRLGEYLERGSAFPDAPAPRQLHELTRACLRVYQTIIAHSDAGGEAYNAILRPVFEKLLPEDIEDPVLFWRRVDALGDPESAGNPRFPHETIIRGRIRAFDLAWSRGLYRAAYAV